MKGWNIDANTINSGEINTNDLNNLMVTTRAIKDFLSIDTRKMFIVAPKGLGKTFLLKIKSQLYRNKASGFKFIPHDTLCESFTSNDISFSEKEVQKFKERSIWNKLWELCLYTLILKSFKSNEIPSEIISVIGEDTGSLSEILGALLYERGSIEKLHSLVSLRLKPAVRKLKDNSSANQIAIFIDNIDEAFDSFVGFNTINENKAKAPGIWINSQLSLLTVAREISLINHHVKIFLTVRSEAYKNFDDPLQLQISDNCVFLEYTKEQIREIFIKNIQLTEKDDLAELESIDPIINFFGYNTIPHKFIQDDFGENKKEDVFDFIFRHSYGRPRDIVLMGQSIILKSTPIKRSNTDLIGSIINEQSYNLFEQLKNETIPVFEEEIFEKFCLRIKSNVIAIEDAFKISHQFKEEGFENVFSYFYRLGLIGAVESDMNKNNGNDSGLKQSYLPVGQYSLTKESIPEFQYFVLHPSLNKKMKQIYDVGFYDRFNIIGYDCPFYPQKINRLENHFHFGLDRDSITAIIPIIQANTSLAILAPTNGEWSEMSKANTFILKINGIDYSFKVYRDDLVESEKNEIKKNWKDKKYHVVIHSSHLEQIAPFFEKSITSSLCLFDPYIDIYTRLLNECEIKSHQHTYYCMRVYDKDQHKLFERRINDSRKQIVPEILLFDRFLYSYELYLNSDESVLHCTVESEEFCQIICRNRPSATLKKLDKIILIHDDEEFTFYKRRQNLMLEGTYQFYKVLLSNGYTKKKDYGDVANLFIRIQAIRVLDVYNDNQILNMFNGKTRESVQGDLIKFGFLTMNRVEKLYRSGVLKGNDNDLTSNKEKEIFPNDTQFYKVLPCLTEFFSETEGFIFLQILLHINPSNKYRKVFISYSSIDAVIVVKLANRLKLIGVDVKIFEQDNPVSTVKKYMHQVVKDNDHMLFIASKNSLMSDSCHHELSNCIELIRSKNNPDKLIVLRLDDYVITVQMEDIMDNQRISNFEYLRKQASLQNSIDISKQQNLRYLDRILRDLILKSAVNDIN